MAKPNKPKDTLGNILIKLVNKLFLLLNLAALGFVVFQVIDFLDVYKKKNDEMFQQGRIITINAKTNELGLSDITQAEIDQKRKEAQEKAKPAEPKKAPTEDDFIGPKQKASDEGDVYGPAPLKNEEEKKAAEAKKKMAPMNPLDYNTANLGIVITEIGLKQSEIDLAQELPREVTFAFSPYSDELQKKIDLVSKDGREILINLMMQPSSYPIKDNGPNSIQANYDEPQNLTRLVATLNAAKKYKGLLATNDEVVTSKFDKMSPVLKTVSERGLFLGYFKATSNANLENDAKPLAADIFGIDYLVDENPSEADILKMLNVVKEDLVLKKKRVVIAIRPYPVSINTLKKWLNENVSANIQIAPVSYFVTNN